MKKTFTVVAVMILLTLVGGGYWAYDQLVVDRQQLQSNTSILDTNQQEQDATSQTSTNTPKRAANSASETTPPKYNPDTQIPKESTATISNLMKGEDDNRRCTFTASLPSPYDGNKIYTYSGDIYISGEKVRIDHNNALPQINGISTERHMIFDGTYFFVWSKNFQWKVNIRTFFPTVSRKVDNDRLLDPIDLTRVYTFTCTPLSLDETGIFSPPADIVFQELSK